MTKRSLLTYIVLLALTLVTGLVSMSAAKYGVVLILILSGVKFMGVAFEFMNMRAAHNFWKVALTVFLLVYIVIVLTLL